MWVVLRRYDIFMLRWYVNIMVLQYQSLWYYTIKSSININLNDRINRMKSVFLVEQMHYHNLPNMMSFLIPQENTVEL